MFLVKKIKIARKKKSVDVMATGGYMMISPSNQPPPETETMAETLTSQLGKMTSYTVTVTFPRITAFQSPMTSYTATVTFPRITAFQSPMMSSTATVTFPRITEFQSPMYSGLPEPPFLAGAGAVFLDRLRLLLLFLLKGL